MICVTDRPLRGHTNSVSYSRIKNAVPTLTDRSSRIDSIAKVRGLSYGERRGISMPEREIWSRRRRERRRRRIASQRGGLGSPRGGAVLLIEETFRVPARISF
jgi:hypothetical protein